jgi:hypothetical protein
MSSFHLIFGDFSDLWQKKFPPKNKGSETQCLYFADLGFLGG